MAQLNLGSSGKRHINESTFKTTVQHQKEINGNTLAQLNKFGVGDDSRLGLEFFFYTNNQDKARNLALELKKLNYNIVTVDKSAGNPKLWVVTGWTTPIQMDVNSVTMWSKYMCRIGFQNDCDFDGWGTTPDQGDFEVEDPE